MKKKISLWKKVKGLCCYEAGHTLPQSSWYRIELMSADPLSGLEEHSQAFGLNLWVKICVGSLPITPAAAFMPLNLFETEVEMRTLQVTHLWPLPWEISCDSKSL